MSDPVVSIPKKPLDPEGNLVESNSDDTKQEISTALGQVGDRHKANQMNISTDAMGLQEPSTSKESETESLGASQEMSKLRKRPSDAKETSEYEVLTKKSCNSPTIEATKVPDSDHSDVASCSSSKELGTSSEFTSTAELPIDPGSSQVTKQADTNTDSTSKEISTSSANDNVNHETKQVYNSNSTASVSKGLPNLQPISTSTRK